MLSSDWMSSWRYFPLAGLLAILCTACSEPAGRASGPDRGDGGGHDYQRVVAMSPSVVEIIFALGQGDRVVGVSDYTTYPPEADGLPRCGGYVNPNFEIILSLNPDLLITHGAAGEVGGFATRYGIKAVNLEIDNLESIYDSIELIAELLDSPEEAAALIAGMRKTMAELVGEKVVEQSLDSLLVVGRDPASLREVYVVGPGGFLDEMLELAGGRNIMHDLNRQYGTISKEVIAQRAPAVIIELHGEGMMEDHEREQYLGVWQDMNTIPAVANRNIYVIEETFAMLPGPRSVRIAERMREIMKMASHRQSGNQ